MELATIVTSVLMDLKIITKDDTSKIFDRSAVRRQRARCRAESRTEKIYISDLYFDSKIDYTMQPCKTLKPVNHVTLLNEPGSQYITHKSMAGHTAVDLLNGIIEGVPAEDLDKIKGVGADGTNTNTGLHGGAIALLENKLKRKLHWNVSSVFNIKDIIIKYIINCEFILYSIN